MIEERQDKVGLIIVKTMWPGTRGGAKNTI